MKVMQKVDNKYLKSDRKLAIQIIIRYLPQSLLLHKGHLFLEVSEVQTVIKIVFSDKLLKLSLKYWESFCCCGLLGVHRWVAERSTECNHPLERENLRERYNGPYRPKHPVITSLVTLHPNPSIQ